MHSFIEFGFDNYLVILLTFLVTLFCYVKYKQSHWSRQGLKGPKPLLLLGNVLDTQFKPNHNYEDENVQKYGKVYGVYEGLRPILKVTDADVIKDILVKDFSTFVNHRDSYGEPVLDHTIFGLHDDRWRNIRSVVSPAFSSGKMRKQESMYLDSVRSAMNELVKIEKAKGDVDIPLLVTNYTMDIIGQVAFGTKFNSHIDNDNPFIKSARKMLEPSLKANIAFFFPNRVFRWLGITLFDQEAVEFFFKATRQLINDRTKANAKNTVKPNDFIQLMLDARQGESEADKDSSSEEESTGYIRDESNNLVLNKKKQGLTDDEIESQAFSFLVDGLTTTATQMSYLFYELAVNQNIQQRLYEEITSIVPPGKDVNYDHLNQMTYLDACFNETMRLHSFVLILERAANKDYKMVKYGLHVPKGQVIQIGSWAVHHNPEYWPEPNEFRPDRFLAENKDQIYPYSFLPFGHGPRGCIGTRMALFIVKLIVVEMLLNYRIVKSANTKPMDYMFALGFGLAFPKDLKVSIEKRKNLNKI